MKSRYQNVLFFFYINNGKLERAEMISFMLPDSELRNERVLPVFKQPLTSSGSVPRKHKSINLIQKNLKQNRFFPRR
jgi:hypothetical protein